MKIKVTFDGTHVWEVPWIINNLVEERYCPRGKWFSETKKVRDLIQQIGLVPLPGIRSSKYQVWSEIIFEPNPRAWAREMAKKIAGEVTVLEPKTLNLTIEIVEP